MNSLIWCCHVLHPPPSMPWWQLAPGHRIWTWGLGQTAATWQRVCHATSMARLSWLSCHCLDTDPVCGPALPLSISRCPTAPLSPSCIASLFKFEWSSKGFPNTRLVLTAQQPEQTGVRQNISAGWTIQCACRGDESNCPGWIWCSYGWTDGPYNLD